MYAANGRASIPPEHLLKALFLGHSECHFCERLEYDLLSMWFVDLNIKDRSFDHSVFSKGRQRLLDGDAAREFPAGHSGAGQGAAAAVGGAFKRGRHPAEGLGLGEPSQG